MYIAWILETLVCLLKLTLFTNLVFQIYINLDILSFDLSDTSDPNCTQEVL